MDASEIWSILPMYKIPVEPIKYKIVFDKVMKIHPASIFSPLNVLQPWSK